VVGMANEPFKGFGGVADFGGNADCRVPRWGHGMICGSCLSWSRSFRSGAGFRRRPLEDAAVVFEELRRGAVLGRVVLTM